MIRDEQCSRVCRILDDILANRPTERDALIVAVRKAFDALSAQPERKKSELPEEARKSAEEYCEECDHIEMCSWYPYEGCAFRRIPQPEWKKGHWVHDGGMWTNRWVCNKCNYKLFGVRTNFCPDCGATMGDENEEPRRTE